jgi:hypothetical protein
MLAESRSLRRKLVRHPVDAGLDHWIFDREKSKAIYRGA